MTSPDLPDLDVSSTVDPRPDTQHVLSAPHAKNGTADLISSFRELVAHHGQQKVLPVPVSNSLLQSDDPLPTLLVGLIFPDGTDTLLEDVVVGNSREERWSLQVGIDTPEAFNRGNGCQCDC